MAFSVSDAAVLLVLVSVCGQIRCACRHSYVTFCDSLDDLDPIKIANWTEVVIGSEDGPSRMRSIDINSIPFDRFDKLTTMVILGQINEIKTYGISIDQEGSKLENLFFYGNDIRRLRYSAFDAIKLRKLSLKNNNLEYIHKEAFYNCDIETIDLSENKLETIEVSVFTEDLLANSTKEIVLKHNRLVSIEPDSFPGSLEILNLDYNNLAVVKHDIFDNLHNLRELTMSHNQLTVVPNVKELDELQIMDLSHNKLPSITIKDFNKLENLEVLDLSHNMISTPTMFKSFQFPQRHPSLQVSLAFNRFTHLLIENDSFRHHIVLLYGNPWNCKCWQILEKFLVDNCVKRSSCDLNFFGSGGIPYCINYTEENNCTKTFLPKTKLMEAEQKQFLDLIATSGNVPTCNLSPSLL